MTTNHLPGNRDLPDMSRSMFAEATYSGIGFGLGFSVTMDPAKTLIAGSPGEYAWGGAATTSFWIDPAEDLITIFMTQVIPSTRLSDPPRTSHHGVCRHYRQQSLMPRHPAFSIPDQLKETPSNTIAVIARSGLADRGQCPLRRDQVRNVIHLALDTHRADIRLTGEGRNDAVGVRQIGFRWREAGVDGGNLVRMDRESPDKSVAAGDPATLGEARLILEITVQGLKRENARRVSRKKALGTRDLIRERPVAIRLFIGQRAKRGAEIFRAPCHGHQP